MENCVLVASCTQARGAKAKLFGMNRRVLSQNRPSVVDNRFYQERSNSRLWLSDITRYHANARMR